MYYSDPIIYIGDIVRFYAPDNRVLERRLKPGMLIRYNGRNVPVKLNAFNSGFIIIK